jgi:hypothetical protein
MASLKFDGEITLDQVFNSHRGMIYDQVLAKIKESYQDLTIYQVKIISIQINEVTNSINLPRNKFVSGLENAIEYYVEHEEYEKCQICLNIINDIKEKNLEEVY